MTREELLDISTRYLAYMNEPMKYADDLPLIVAKDSTLKISYPQMPPGCEGFKQFREKMYTENPDMTFTATQTLANEQESCAAMLLKITGTINNEYLVSADIMLTDRSFFAPGKGSFDIYGAIFLKVLYTRVEMKLMDRLIRRQR